MFGPNADATLRAVTPMRREQEADLRRHPRTAVKWPVTVESGDYRVDSETINLSPHGAKVRLDEHVLELGAPAFLHFEPPEGTLEMQAIVWRWDPDGSAFFFVELDGDEVSFPSDSSSIDSRPA